MKIARLKKREVLKSFLVENFGIFLTILALVVISSVNQLSMGGTKSYFWRNLLWHFIGLIVFFVIFLSIDYRKITLKAVYLLYTGLLILIGIMDLFKTRWINLGFISIQPSEFIKPLLALIFSLEAEKASSSVLPSRVFLKLLLTMGIGILLIFITDLDYAFIIGVTFFTFLLFLGVPKRIFFSLLAVVILIVVTLGPFAWRHVLKPHQKGRIYGYLHPEKYASSWGYQMNQSLIAIGSGGLFGQGFKKGWSTRLNYLPAKRTDLAFSVWAESWGFIGVTIFLFLYAYLLYYTLYVSSMARDWLGKYLSFVIGLILFWQAFFNIGGATGLLPMTSIPLPFLSYGGSITISVYFLLSLLFNIAFKRYFFK